jgi:hypothetical protein
LFASSFFEGITTDFDCCLKAMEFEGTSWDKGGAALFFQQGQNAHGGAGDYCRVDREKIIYGNMDSSSGRSVKYQDTRCGSAHFFYRHAAGAADAANLHTGGKCVMTGGFKKAPLTSGTNLPKGELPEGWELPGACSSDTPDHEGCAATLKFNTINDAEECCRMCSELSWLAPNTPNVGGDAARDPETDYTSIHVSLGRSSRADVASLAKHTSTTGVQRTQYCKPSPTLTSRSLEIQIGSSQRAVVEIPWSAAITTLRSTIGKLAHLRQRLIKTPPLGRL